MTVQSIAFTDLNTEVIIPLGINVLQGQDVTISLDTADLPDDLEIYLEDSVSNTFTLLNTSNYSFTAESTLTSTGRFYLRFNPIDCNLPTKLPSYRARVGI